MVSFIEPALSGCVRCCGRSEGVVVDVDMDDGTGEGEGREGMNPPPVSASVAMVVFKVVIVVM